MDRTRGGESGGALRELLRSSNVGAVLMLLAAVAALVWANSGAAASYGSFWETAVGPELGPHGALTLQEWVTDGAMTLFFLLVALEIKRELTTGELRERRTALLPALAAAGGMVLPAALYLALNLGGPGERGWGIPTATDVAFAVAVVAAVGSRIPNSAKVFLLALAIVDDLGAIVIIAVFYTQDLAPLWLVVAAATVAIAVLLRRTAIRLTALYVLLGVVCWYALLRAGVHPTMAGVAFGLLTPARPYADQAVGSPTAAERSEHLLTPWVSFLVVPVFALANAGVVIPSNAVDAVLHDRIALGVLLGLLVGKPLGITAAVWFAVRMRWGMLPSGTTLRHVLGLSVCAGIGFTVALFVTELAFTDEESVNAAKLGILVASVLAAVLGYVALRLLPPRETTT